MQNDIWNVVYSWSEVNLFLILVVKWLYPTATPTKLTDTVEKPRLLKGFRVPYMIEWE